MSKNKVIKNIGALVKGRCRTQTVGPLNRTGRGRNLIKLMIGSWKLAAALCEMFI